MPHLKFSIFSALDDTSPNFLNTLTCWSLTHIGLYCNISSKACDILQPCRNNGTCNNIDDNRGYTCSCPLHFTGSQCEYDKRPCKESTCWNNGISKMLFSSKI